MNKKISLTFATHAINKAYSQYMAPCRVNIYLYSDFIPFLEELECD